MRHRYLVSELTTRVNGELMAQSATSPTARILAASGKERRQLTTPRPSRVFTPARAIEREAFADL